MRAKIGIMTFHSSVNYGTMLQAYALQRYLILCGYECVIIDYVTKSHEKEYLPDGICSIPRKNPIRYKRFMKFMKNHMILTERKYYTSKEVETNFPECDIYLTGSDQVWNVEFKDCVTPMYFLNLPQFKNRIAYGPSMGKCDLRRINNYRKYLENYEYIFPRENSVAIYLTKILNRKIDSVIDPTLLIKREQWKKFIHSSKKRKPYLLYYIAADDDYSFGKAKKVAKVLGIEIIAISYEREYWGHRVFNCISAGPIEFLNLIYNADFVFTTSFHGSVFSIIYNVPFYTIGQYEEDNRIKNLIRIFHLDSRLLTKDKKMILNKHFLLQKPDVKDEKLELIAEDSRKKITLAIKSILDKEMKGIGK